MPAVKKSREYPDWVYPSMRAFKAAKRADMRAALKALDNLRIGCVWCPEFERLKAAMEEIANVAEAWRVKKWGR